jgi:hypothetical protein
MRIQTSNNPPLGQAQLKLASKNVRRISGQTPKLKQFIASTMGREEPVRKANGANSSKDDRLPSQKTSAKDALEQTFSSTPEISTLATAAAIAISRSEKRPWVGIAASTSVAAAGGYLLAGSGFGEKKPRPMHWDSEKAIKGAVGAGLSAALTAGLHYGTPTATGKNIANSLKKVMAPIKDAGKRFLDPTLSFRLKEFGPTLKESIQKNVPIAAFSPGYFIGAFVDKIYPSYQKSNYGALPHSSEARAKSSLSTAK